MRRLHIIHRLRTALFLLVSGGIAAALGLLWWANHIGMPESWRNAIERNIAEHDIHVEIGSLSLHPLKGIMASRVSVFSDASRKQVISRLEGVILDLDNSQLAKGRFQLAQIKLSNAKLSLPVDPKNPDSEVIEVTGIEGTFIPPGNRFVEIRNARGTISGIQLILDAKIADDLSEPPAADASLTTGNQRELISKIIRELRNWRFSDQSPPQIRIQVEGRRSEPEQITAEIAFRALDAEKNQHRLERIEAHARLHRNLLSVTSLEAGTGRQALTAHLDYDLTDKTGRFDLQSALEIPELLQAWMGVALPGNILIAGDQQLHAAGKFTLRSGRAPDMHVTGMTRCDSAMLRGIRFDLVESSFAWLNGDLFLKDLRLTRPDGEVTGKVMIQGPLVRLDLRSSLLPRFYRPLFAGKPLEKLINDFSAGEGSRFELDLEGGFDLNDSTSWAYSGNARMSNMRFRDVALAEVTADLSLSSSQMEFSNGAVEFDYSDYPMAKRFNGPDRGRMVFERVLYRRGDQKQVTFSGVEGSFWPAPLCRLFLTRTADHLEKYGFHQPPGIRGSGVIGLEDPEQTRIEISFRSEHAAQYQFLGSPVTVRKPTAVVVITNEGTFLTDFQFQVFEGQAVADMQFPRERPMIINLDCNSLSMDAISECYKLKMDCGGSLTGKLRFEMSPGRINTMQGEGNFILSRAELFSVPMFGPLSNLMQAVLNDKRAGAERAKDATCNFRVRNGIVATNDFRTTTTSLIFVGVGSVDLSQMTMDMTMRVNARGLLGIIFLPLKPFAGMFQFQGTGPLSQTEWKRVSFTNPDARLKQLLEAPRAGTDKAAQ